jgi:polysaccharide deacetylase family protein (PEP-CTERM system associated)
LTSASGGSSAPGRLRPLAAFTVDVEDWYQSCVDFDAPISERVVRNVDRILAVLEDFGVKGTFFVQGRVAESFPKLVRCLVEEGHEIQAHGYSHRPLYAMNRQELRDELKRSHDTVEDAAAVPITAFRAQDFSITSDTLWALDVLAEVGFTVDSSIFPMRTRRYGIRGWPLGPHYVDAANGARLLEVPVAVWAHGRWRLPVGGGGYFRIAPAKLLERALSSIAQQRPAVVYCHPYEFNATELGEYGDRIPAKLRFSQGLGRGSFVERVRHLLRVLDFGRFDRLLGEWGYA